MVFYCIVGKLCSGKSMFIDYCKEYYNFDVIDFKENNIDYNQLDENNGFEKIKQKWQQNKIDIKDFFNKYILKNLQKNVIFKDIRDLELIKQLKEFTYVKVIYLDCSIMERFNQYKLKYNENCQLQRFILLDDYINYEAQQNVIYELSDIKIVNNSGSKSKFLETVEKCRLIKKVEYRPSWDDYFMKIALICKIRSNCLQMNQGALLVQDNRIISTGYMGTPGRIKNCFEGGCEGCQKEKADSQKKDCYCVHPIENILLEAGIKNANGGTVYVTQFPCIWCSKLLIGAGIKRVLYQQNTTSNCNSNHDHQSILDVFSKAKIIIDQYHDLNQIYIL